MLDMVSWWTFDTDASDLLEINPGTVNGATYTTLGCQNSGCYDFDGDNDYINYGNDDSLDFANSFTISAWIYPTSFPTYGTIIDRGSVTGSDEGYLFFIRNDFETISLWDGTPIDADASAISLNTWQHVVVVYSNANVYFYVDGVPKGGGAWSYAPSGSADFYIGALDGSSELFDGNIDEVMIWDRALTPSEISEVHDYF